MHVSTTVIRSFPPAGLSRILWGWTRRCTARPACRSRSATDPPISRPRRRSRRRGEFPFTRGNFPTGYRGRLWTIRQYSGFGTAEESNERYRYLLAQGGTGLSVALDLPTQCGYDSDHPDVEEEVGRVGVALDTLADAEILFDQIPLDSVSTSFTINGTAAILLAFYVAAGEKQGVPAGQAARHDPERHPQGVRQPRDVDLAAAALASADRRHHRVLRPGSPAVQRDLGGRRALSRCRRQCGTGDGVHAHGRRHLLRRGHLPRADDDRRVRASGVVLLLHARRLLRGDREVPGRPATLGAHRARAIRRQG